MKNIKNQENKKIAALYYKNKAFFDRNNILPNPPIIFDIGSCSDVMCIQRYPRDSRVEILNIDVLDMAKTHIVRGYNPVILNFASRILPGGGVKKGAQSQEEDIFRRTNLYQSLNRKNCSYPLEKIVYTESIYVAFDKKGNPLKEPYSLACISAAAVRWPVVAYTDGKESFFISKDEDYVRDTIHTIFRVAILSGHDSIILGAWGCGAYEGPRHAIAAIFKECVDLYSKEFKMIGFSILVRNGRDKENYEIFKNIIS